MIFKPHTFTRRSSTSQVGGDLVVGGKAYGVATSYTGQITPLAANAVYEAWGVNLNRPHLLLADLTDAQDWKVGDLITMGTRFFKVETPVKIWDSGGVVASADHCEIVIEEMQYAVTL